MSFKNALEKTLDHEGRVLTNDPHDRGGETYWGISRKWFPKWPGWFLLDGGADPTPELVAAHYHIHFWKPLQCENMPEAIAEKLFDTAVNIGIDRAVKILQACVNVKTDGHIGPVTLAAVSACNEAACLHVFREIQAEYYQAIVRNDPTQERFLNGWFARARS
jgi:lysozyme family protein